MAELADEAIDMLVEFWKGMPMHGEVEIISLGGAIGPENLFQMNYNITPAGDAGTGR